MSEGNGYNNHRLDTVEAEARDLRTQMDLGFRAVRADLKHVLQQLKQTGDAVDLILAELRLKDIEDEGV